MLVQNEKVNLRNRIFNCLFLISYILYIVQRYLHASALGESLDDNLKRSIKLIMLLLLGAAIRVKAKYRVKTIRKISITLVIGIVTSIFSQDIDIICIVLFICFSTYVDYRSLLKTYFWTNIILLGLIISLSRLV